MSHDEQPQALQEQVDALAAGLDDHDLAIGQIAAEVAALAQAGDAGADQAPGSRARSGGGWTAYGSDPQALAARMGDLRAWFVWAYPTILFPRSAEKEIPDCWEQHPGVVEELLALYAAWVAAYAEARPNEGRIAWHDRWVGPFLDRVFLGYGLNECRRNGGHVQARQARGTDVAAAPEPATAGGVRA
ncbi:hypothetical protein PZ938_00215 [Luteipulveratus sp. YIM 133132]|uniref:hypothetical protein n=1 Tax=Luteipulveratus flavus TaxID=3031728 RepID=UPI0023B0E412|nr:hypothetical protein [Luteipulveratus sp. YIM 133132]MDE9364018.1 hypothetical protein [Luteipulveratus sp. YIM 133132]